MDVLSCFIFQVYKVNLVYGFDGNYAREFAQSNFLLMKISAHVGAGLLMAFEAYVL